jgi:hypothetical protein
MESNMKSPEEIVRYIEDFYSQSLERPKMFFLSPSAMEEVLFKLERLYEFIVDDEWKFPGCCDFGYAGFLGERGYGVGRFTDEERCGPDEFLKMAAFWREYLASDWRKGPHGERNPSKYHERGPTFNSGTMSIEEILRGIEEWEKGKESQEAGEKDKKDGGLCS